MSETENQKAAESHGCLCMGMGPQISEMARHVVPESTREHFRNARVEVLKGLRTLIDRRIEQLTKTTAKGTPISVDLRRVLPVRARRMARSDGNLPQYRALLL